MPKSSLRSAALICLAIWAAVWLLFLVLRLSTFDIRIIPGAGGLMLSALVTALLTPVVATGLAIAALVRQPRVPLNALTLAGALAALFGQVLLFLSTRWL